MSDEFYSLLARKIDDVERDPAQTRQVIYDAARAALRTQINLQRPYPGRAEIRQRMEALEEAIAQIEADAARAPSRPDADTGADVDPSYAAGDAGAPEQWPDGRRDVVVAPARYAQGGAGPPAIYDINVDAGYDGARAYYAPQPPQPASLSQRILSSLALLAQLTIASAAGVTIYALVSGRGLPPAAGSRPASEEAGRPAPPPEPARAPVVDIAPPPSLFPLPTMFGVYAIRDRQLVELDQAATAPADPRTRNLLQITKPPRTTFPDGKLAFVVFRRELIINAPEKVPIRIAARISRMMNFDSNGKVVATAPASDTWFIRDIGYDMRVVPVRESQEMILVRPDDLDFTLPAGRYELLINNQPYDFAVEGPVTSPAHCVEGSATMRGPIFYECRNP